jgi:hypothetical protein
MSKIEKIPENYFLVRYSNSDRFNSFWKFFPWEGAGWITLKRGELIFLSEHNQDVVVKKFPKKRASVEWVGMHLMRNAALSWFRIDIDERSYYFTSETGVTVFGSKKGTRKIYEMIRKHYR